MRINLDMDCLRTFVAIADCGGFSKAAARVGRTPSAVSLQMTRLEQQLGPKLFRKSGRRMLPSEEGERLLFAARRMLELNDQTIDALSLRPLHGEIAIGATQDIADSILPAALARFKAAHSAVRITARVDRTSALAQAIDSGSLDLAIGFANPDAVAGAAMGEVVHREPMRWFAAQNLALAPDAPTPLVVFDPPCPFREAAVASLEAAGRAWEIVFSSPSLSGLRAAVQAGLGVTVRTRMSFAGQDERLAQPKALPPLPEAGFALFRQAAPSEPTTLLARAIREEISDYGSLTPRASRRDP